MATLKTKIPEEIESVYQFLDGKAYRVVTDLSVSLLDVAGKERKCHRLVSIDEGTPDDVIKRFLDHDTDRPVNDSPSVTKRVTKSDEGESTTPPKSVTKRGRPKTAYPVEKIMKFHSDGMTTRDIQKVTGVSHMTVSRIIAGQKSLI